MPPSPDSVPKSGRDSDLIQPDNYLTNGKLDELWDWYSGAIQNKMDSQLIFVKLINSVQFNLLSSTSVSVPLRMLELIICFLFQVRKCYQGEHFASTVGSFAQGCSLYTPSEFTATDSVEPLCDKTGLEDLRASLEEAQTEVATKEAMIGQLQERLITMDKEREKLVSTKEREKKELQLQFDSLKEDYEKRINLSQNLEPTYIATRAPCGLLSGKFACRGAKVWRRGEGGGGEIYSGASLRQKPEGPSGGFWNQVVEVDRNFFVC
ncbi:hypothetical protein BDZ91DRAFT_802235 [Kalaharituber pfeilii]|nr:hypothetical protein BDZ91DRAFT_802235 [Kalaharituber pfeilii]